jgi:hypothetical protein
MKTESGRSSLYDELIAAFQQLVGRKCVGFSGGETSGSDVLLDFEPRRRRKRRLTAVNPSLSEEDRLHYSEHCLMLKCAWRLDSQDEILTGAGDDNTRMGPMLAGLDRLLKQEVVSIELARPGLDLAIMFQNELTLRVFCDQVNELDGDENYNLFLPGECFVIARRSRLSKEAIRPNPR